MLRLRLNLGSIFWMHQYPAGKSAPRMARSRLWSALKRRPHEAAKPLMACYAKSIRRMGGVGSGQLTKMVNQICIAGLLQGLSEGMHFAERAGLDVSGAMEVIAQGAAQSWQMNNRASTMITGDFDFGFAVDWMRKDSRYSDRRGPERWARGAGHRVSRSASMPTYRVSAGIAGTPPALFSDETGPKTAD